MLTLFRRHLASCKFRSKGRSTQSCTCPIAVEGTLHGKKIRKSLDLRNWEAAVRTIRDWEVYTPEGSVLVDDAADRYLRDCEARKLSEGMMKKCRHFAAELKRELGKRPLRSITVDDIRRLRERWKLAPVTTQKRLELVRSFFRFCVDSGWMDRNPATAIKLPVVHADPTLPFTDEEMEKILWAADSVREIHPQMKPGVAEKAAGAHPSHAVFRHPDFGCCNDATRPD